MMQQAANTNAPEDEEARAIMRGDRLGPVAPCRECDAAGFRKWAVGCGLVAVMAERSGE